MVRFSISMLACALLAGGVVAEPPRDSKVRSSSGTVAVRKKCMNCGKEVSATAKVGDRCPHCRIVWGAASALPGDARPQQILARRPTTVSVQSLGSVVAARLRALDMAINGQDGLALADILTVNFVSLGKDGRVQLDADRFVETAIADAAANSLSRKSVLKSAKIVDGEIVATVKVISKRYPPDQKPEYHVTYEQETWSTVGGTPRLRVIRQIKSPTQ